MIGAIIGDVVGSRFEFNNIDTKDFEFMTDRCCFTDDTVMTCAVARALLRCDGNYNYLGFNTVMAMKGLGIKYPDAGYGGMFYNWLMGDDDKPYNSYGNGSAMRVSAVGNVARTVEEAKELSYKVTAVTHNHPEGIKGAECVAVCMVLAKQGKSKEEIKEYVRENYGYEVDKTVDQWRKEIGGRHGYEICQVSLPEALSCFFESESFEDCIRNCISIGGDSDTLAAIAAAIAEAYYGVPKELKRKIRDFLPEDLLEITDYFEGKYGVVIAESDKNFYKHNPNDKIWWYEDGHEGYFAVSFDKKNILYLFKDFPERFTEEQIELFCKENPFWAEFFAERLPDDPPRKP